MRTPLQGPSDDSSSDLNPSILTDFPDCELSERHKWRNHKMAQRQQLVVFSGMTTCSTSSVFDVTMTLRSTWKVYGSHGYDRCSDRSSLLISYQLNTRHSIYLFICPSIHPSIHPFICLSIIYLQALIVNVETFLSKESTNLILRWRRKSSPPR